MQQVSQQDAGRHLAYLDSARGLAALMVFLGHFISQYYFGPFKEYYLLIFNANDAVAFFFVLSGFVLSYRYIVLRQPLDFRKFYVRRLLRIYPAYLVVFLTLFLFGFRNELNAAKLADIFIYNKEGFWEEVVLLRFHNSHYYPGWTLSIELLCSFLVPFYLILAIYNKKLIPWLLFVTFVIGANVFYSSLFFYGIILASNYEWVTGERLRETIWYKWRYPVILASYLLFSLRHIDIISPLGPSLKDLLAFLNIDFYSFSGLACFVFLAAILNSRRLKRVLSLHALVFLGKISYSVYLVHLMVMDVIAANWGTQFTPDTKGVTVFGFFCLSVGAIIVLATIVHYCIEKPFIRLGKKMAARMKESPVYPATG